MPNIELINIDKIDGGDAFSNYTAPSPNGIVFELTVQDQEDIANAVKSVLDLDLKTILGLSQNNFRFLNQVYNSAGLLTSGTIKIYNNSSDVSTDTNPLAIYSVLSSYDTNNKLIDYQVIKI